MSNKIVIYGDIMLDEFNFGVLRRLSPEGPHPLINLISKQKYLGGVGHVAALISNYSMECELHTATGQDLYHQELQDLLIDFGIKSIFYRQDKTTVKKRYIVEGQTVLRVDEDGYFEASMPVKLVSDSLCVISDYGKGFINRDLISKLASNNNKIFADVKHKDPKTYDGCYLIKPNLREFNNFTLSSGSEAERALQILTDLNIKYLWITKGNEGSTLYYMENLKIKQRDFKVPVQEVVDVTGAGDVMLATLISELVASNDIEAACIVAHQMASIAVSRVGTKPLTDSDLQQAKQRTRDGKLVFTNGCFDVLHQGHLNLLQYCKSLGSRVVVGLNSDKSIKRLKGSERPINHQSFRKRLLEELGCVDEVVILDEDTPINLIKSLNPDILVKGDDYKIEQVIGAEHVLNMGGEVKLFKRHDNISTTQIIEKIIAK